VSLSRTGKIIITNSNPQEAGGLADGTFETLIWAVRQFMSFKNLGPDVVYIQTAPTGFGTTDGWPLEAGEVFQTECTGGFYLRCPTATEQNPVSVVYLASERF
jgi:hypothetical protein